MKAIHYVGILVFAVACYFFVQDRNDRAVLENSEGYKLFSDGNYGQAIDAFNRDVVAGAKNHMVYKYLGDACYYEKRFYEAIQAYDKSLELKSFSNKASNNKKVAVRAQIAARGNLDIVNVMTHEELEPIVVPMLDKWSNSLPQKNPEFKKDYSKFANKIREEIILFGGNTFANLGRKIFGGQLYYDEIVYDVCDYCDVEGIGKSMAVMEMEQLLLEKIAEDAVNHMTDAEKERLIDVLREGGMQIAKDYVHDPTALVDVIRGGFVLGGFQSYTMAVTIANQISSIIVGHGLTFAANAALTKGLAAVMTGPLGWAIDALWISISIAGPSYKVTASVVPYIASMRQAFINAPLEY